MKLAGVISGIRTAVTGSVRLSEIMIAQPDSLC